MDTAETEKYSTALFQYTRKANTSIRSVCTLDDVGTNQAGWERGGGVH
jgi:hypothetical protein